MRFHILVVSLFIISFKFSFAQEFGGINQAKILYSQGRYRAAIELLEKLTEHSSSQFSFYELLGLCYQGISNHERALRALNNAKTIDSTGIGIRLAIGRSYENLGLIEEAEAEYAGALSIDSTEGSVLAALGGLFTKTGRWGEAREIYKTLSDQDSSVAFFHIQLGKCNLELRLYDEAIISFERALHRNSKNADVVIELATIYQATNRFISAGRTIERALGDYPQNRFLWKRKGDIEFRLGSYDAAIAAYEKSMTFGDTSAGLQKVLGISHQFLGRNVQAERFLEKSYELDNTDPSTCFYLGVVKRYLGQTDQADRYLRESATLLTTGLLPDVYLQIAVNSQIKNDIKDAVRYYKLALFTDPSNLEALFHLATAYDEYYADKSVAEIYYQKFLRLSDDNQQVLREYAHRRLSTIRESRHFDKNKVDFRD